MIASFYFRISLITQISKSYNIHRELNSVIPAILVLRDTDAFLFSEINSAPYSIPYFGSIWHGPLTGYVKMRVAHALGMPGTFPRHRLQRKPLASDPCMHHGTCVTHVPWCMSGSLTLGNGEIVPGVPGACATRNVTYLVRGPCGCYVSNKLHLVNAGKDCYG